MIKRILSSLKEPLELYDDLMSMTKSRDEWRIRSRRFEAAFETLKKEAPDEMPKDIAYKIGDLIESKSGVRGVIVEVSTYGVFIDSDNAQPYRDCDIPVGVAFESIISHNQKTK